MNFSPPLPAPHQKEFPCWSVDYTLAFLCKFIKGTWFLSYRFLFPHSPLGGTWNPQNKVSVTSLAFKAHPNCPSLIVHTQSPQLSEVTGYKLLCGCSRPPLGKGIGSCNCLPTTFSFFSTSKPFNLQVTFCR